MMKVFSVIIPCLLLTPFAWSQSASLDEAEVVQLFDTGNFDALESIKDKALVTKERNIEGNWQLECFYGILKKHGDEMAAESESKFRAHLDAWAKVHPKSVTWRILLGHTLTTLGWTARGSGFAPDITPEAWKGFEKYLTEAWQILQEARNITRQDPELYPQLIDVVQGFAIDPTPGKYLPFGPVRGPAAGAPLGNDQQKLFAERVFEEAIGIERTYTELYVRMAQIYLERWYGESRDLEKFAERAATITAADMGDSMYSRIAWSMLSMWGEHVYNFECDFDWPRIKSGFERLIKDYPQSDYLKNEFSYMACAHKDRETALAAHKAITKPLPRKVWRTKDCYDHWTAWIEGRAEYPVFNRLTYAVEMRDLDAIRQLAKEGESLEVTMLGGYTPLMTAITRNNFDMAKLLIDFGANVEATSLTGSTPLIEAVTFADPKIVKLLLDAGAKADRLNPHKMAALHQTAMDGNIPKTTLLLAAKADINVRGQKGWTPLHTAVGKNKPEMVKFLLDKGADISLKLDDGSTPLDVATKQGLGSMIALLK